MRNKLKNFIDKIKVSDIGIFGVLALATGAFAVLSANIPSFVSPKLSTIMHSNIYNGASFEQMQAQVAQLQTSNRKMAQEYKRMSTMIELAQQGQGEATRRIGAMESSLPLLLEAIPPGTQIDTSISTASIDENGKKIEGNGGYAIVSNTAIEGTIEPKAQPIPQEIIIQEKLEKTVAKTKIIANGEFGIALGNEIKSVDAIVSWKDIELKVGTLLLGLKPILSDIDENGNQKLIVGPIENYAQAEQLCTRMTRVGISCLPMAYEGQEMPK